MRHLILWMMKMNKYFFLIFSIGFLLFSCGNDDDGGGGFEVRDVAEVQAEDDLEIQEFLSTHFYNEEDFANPPAGFDFRVVIDTIAGENADRTPLSESDQLETMTIVLEGTNGEDVPHTLYYINARTGIGEQPTVADSTLVKFEGSLLSGSVFDSSNIPTWFDLLVTVRGFAEGVARMRAGDGIIVNEDGTTEVNGFGSAALILPSGLGFFERAQIGIPAFAPIVFNVRLLTVVRADHDQDGILSIDEDVDGDGIPQLDDTDGDLLPNYLDPDDDGDGTLTINEFDENGDGIPDDTDGDGIPDYLDNDNN